MRRTGARGRGTYFPSPGRVRMMLARVARMCSLVIQPVQPVSQFLAALAQREVSNRSFAHVCLIGNSHSSPVRRRVRARRNRPGWTLLPSRRARHLGVRAAIDESKTC